MIEEYALDGGLSALIIYLLIDLRNRVVTLEGLCVKSNGE